MIMQLRSWFPDESDSSTSVPWLGRTNKLDAIVVKVSALLKTRLTMTKKQLVDSSCKLGYIQFNFKGYRIRRWLKPISPLLFSIHDTQLASGIAISVAAIVGVYKGGISVYHFTIASDLVWIAVGTQSVTFLSVRPWLLRKESIHEGAYNLVQLLRVFCITALYTFTFYLSYLQSDIRWDESYNCPVRCLRTTPGGVPRRWMIANYFLLIWNYFDSVLPVFRGGRKAMENLTSAIQRTRERWWKILLQWTWDILDSSTMELALQLGWFGYGVWALIVDLKWGSWFFGGANGGCPVVPNAEEDWGFGQILPLCLLFLPVFAALQSYGDDLVCVASSFFFHGHS